jgi:hypothetical protein
VHGRRRDAPRGPPLYPRRPRALCCASPISSHAAAPLGSPNPSRLGRDSSPVHSAAEEGEEGEKEKRGRRSWRPFSAKTGAARGRIWTRHHQGRLLPLLQRCHAAVFFLFADEPRRPSSPTPALRPVATKVTPSFPCPLWTPRPSSRGGIRCSHRAAAASDAGLRAKLGSFLLQVPLPTPPRTRSRFVPFLHSLSRHAMQRRSWPPSWLSAGAFMFAHAPMQARRPCAVVHPSMRAS